MHPQPQIEIPTSMCTGQEAGQSDWQIEGRTNGGMDSAITIRLPKFLWGIKNSFVNKFELMIAANPVYIQYIIV